jgi:hypothetical protein
MTDIPADAYKRDGHRVNVVVDDGVFTGTLECPGEGRCQAWGGEPAHCGLKDWFHDVGWIDFGEMQTKGADGEWVSCDLPIEIEWVMTGWDEDCELWWRPIPAPVSNMRQGLSALLAYYPNADLVHVENQNDTLREVMRTAPAPPFEHWTYRSEPGPWTTVDLVLAGKPLRLAIWNRTGNVYKVGDDGAVEDDPFIEVEVR